MTCTMDSVNGLRVASRQKIADTADSWTCKRFSDGMFVQIDSIVSDAKISVESNWNDFMIPPWALIIDVFIAVWRYAPAGGENNYNNMA